MDVSTSQYGGGIFSLKVPFSQVTRSRVKLTKLTRTIPMMGTKDASPAPRKHNWDENAYTLYSQMSVGSGERGSVTRHGHLLETVKSELRLYRSSLDY